MNIQFLIVPKFPTTSPISKENQRLQDAGQYSPLIQMDAQKGPGSIYCSSQQGL